MHTFPAENILPLMAFHFVDTFVTDPCLVYQLMPNGSVSDRFVTLFLSLEIVQQLFPGLVRLVEMLGSTL